MKNGREGGERKRKRKIERKKEGGTERLLVRD
jgi:hypothetical protein